ncbi:nucleolus and neural progenitor protein [Hemiscyllium ocellatum]|uniref:nucleolus and neural progenitor protein n=1 Tax=Hemiscyllium ocellatum TaxID=170820 RepID=UPI0029667D2E|nr:nucleolus and neural progenitor protein [Hemiscyllium ocellatum]
MAAGDWNAVHIPRPGSCCSVAAPPACRWPHTDGYIQDLVAACENTLKALNNKLLTTELDILGSLLYIFHNRLRQHKPYCALKQVEQCVKRLHNMQLEGSIQDLIELCPSMSEVQTGKTKYIPSQPVLEWMSLKVLGGCKLMLRLMEMCCKAFLLTIQYLHCKEFIVLNVVVTGLLSRLWIMFRSIVLSLELLYDKLFLLLNEVTKIQDMSYVKEFSFPVSVRQWLGLSYCNFTQMNLSSVSSQMSGLLSDNSGLLDKLFAETEPLLLEDDQNTIFKENKMTDSITSKTDQISDIGPPEQGHREIETGLQLGFEIKSVQVQSHNNPEKSLKNFNCRRLQKSKQLFPLDEFVRRIGATQTFSALCWELQTMFRWFRHQKLKHETCYFGNQFLRCRRLRMVETHGYSFPKKINLIKMSVSRYLIKRSQGKLHQGDIFKYWKTSVFPLQNCKIRRSKLYRRKGSLLKKKLRSSRLHTKEGSKRTFKTISRFAFDTQTAIKRQCVTGDLHTKLGNSGLHQNGKTLALPLDSLRGGGSAIVPNTDDDIDAIFASIGI